MKNQDKVLYPGRKNCLTLATCHQAVELLILVLFITLMVSIVDILLVLTLLASP
jgi:hypothetical protein